MNKNKIQVGDLVVHTVTERWRIEGPGLVIERPQSMWSETGYWFYVLWLSQGYIDHHLEHGLKKLEIPNE
jgi:hypothetical protein